MNGPFALQTKLWSSPKFHHSPKEHHKISNIPKLRREMLQNADNTAPRNLQSPATPHYKREIDAPTPDSAVNLPCATQNDWKTSQGYTIRTPQHLAKKPRNTTNPATLPQAATKLPSRSKSSLQCKWSIGIIHNLYINIFKNGQLDQEGLKGNDNDMQVTFNMCATVRLTRA